jgi:hypothetical protein
MTKHLLAGVAAVGLMSGIAFAQTYIPTSPPVTAPPGLGVRALAGPPGPIF